MAEPVVEQIGAALKTLLEGITTSGGYTRDVSQVVRQRRFTDPTKVADGTIVVVQGARERDDENTNDHATSWLQRFGLQVVLRPTDQSEDVADTLVNRLIGDIEKRLATDEQFNSDALNSWVESVAPVEDAEGNSLGTVVTLAVVYRVSRTDPTANA